MHVTQRAIRAVCACLYLDATYHFVAVEAPAVRRIRALEVTQLLNAFLLLALLFGWRDPHSCFLLLLHGLLSVGWLVDFRRSQVIFRSQSLSLVSSTHTLGQEQEDTEEGRIWSLSLTRFTKVHRCRQAHAVRVKRASGLREVGRLVACEETVLLFNRARPPRMNVAPEGERHVQTTFVCIRFERE